MSLSNLMKIAIECPDQLTDSHLEQILNVWQRKSHGIVLCKPHSLGIVYNLIVIANQSSKD